LVNPPWTGGPLNLTAYGQTVARFVASGVSAGGTTIVATAAVTATPSPVTATPSPVTATPSPVTATPSPVTATPSPVTATSSPVTATSSPVTATPSPDGTEITSASGIPIIDRSGNAWTLVQSASKGLQIAVNGTVDPITANVVLLEILGGKVVQENTAGLWYSIAGPGAAWTLIAAPAVPPTPSPDGTDITTVAASPIIDQAGNAWTLVQSVSKGLRIATNGTVDPITANVVLLETLGGKIVQKNSAGRWY
jgi:hypothetical protein